MRRLATSLRLVEFLPTLACHLPLSATCALRSVGQATRAARQGTTPYGVPKRRHAPPLALQGVRRRTPREKGQVLQSPGRAEQRGKSQSAHAISGPPLALPCRNRRNSRAPRGISSENCSWNERCWRQVWRGLSLKASAEQPRCGLHGRPAVFPRRAFP